MIRFLFADDWAFPSRLARMPDALRPEWLFVAGDVELLEQPSLAIVGTRDPSEVPSNQHLQTASVRGKLLDRCLVICPLLVVVAQC